MAAKRIHKDEPQTMADWRAEMEFILRWADGTESVQPPLPLENAA
jgi:hypothetical protein